MRDIANEIWGINSAGSRYIISRPLLIRFQFVTGSLGTTSSEFSFQIEYLPLKKAHFKLSPFTYSMNLRRNVLYWFFNQYWISYFSTSILEGTTISTELNGGPIFVKRNTAKRISNMEVKTATGWDIVFAEHSKIVGPPYFHQPHGLGKKSLQQKYCHWATNEVW